MPTKALVAYIPVVHRGYVRLFSQCPGAKLLVIGDTVLAEVPELVRDMRAVDPYEAARMVRGLGILGSVSVAGPEDLQGLVVDQIIMPDEEVSRTVAEKYFSGRPVEFMPVFLRWDKKAMTSVSKINPDHVVSHDQAAQELLGEAYREAAKSSDWWRQVGALAVRDGEILFRAHNVHLPSEQTPYVVGDPRSSFNAGESIELSSALHAEIGIIAHAASKGVSLKGADLYVTTFPCTGCARAIAATQGIRRIYYSEGYSQIEGEEVLRSRGIEIVRVDLGEPSS